MKRRDFIALMSAAAAMTPFAARTQRASRVLRIGWLAPGSPATQGNQLQAFEAGLRELGYQPGASVLIEQRWAEGNLERLAGFAAELVRMNVDVILTSATPGIKAAAEATKSIPIVFAATGDPVGEGFVASLAHPGGNITGLSLLGPDLSAKRLEVLTELAPALSQATLIFNPNDSGMMIRVNQTEAAARQLGIKLEWAEVRGVGDFDKAFAAIDPQRPNALITIVDPITLTHRQRILNFAASHRFPAVYELREFVVSGGLASYGPSLSDNFRRSAGYVDRILKGAKPGDLPVEQPSKFELVVNPMTAKALGLAIPLSILNRADEVIE